MSDSPHSLDPDDWAELRAQGHAMLDDMLDHLERLRERPVWQPAPDAVRARFRSPLPRGPTPLGEAHATFLQDVLPYSVGNTHPGFMGWVHGGGTPVGMLAEMLAGGLNANLGGRDHAPIEVERQIVEWVRELFDFPAGASGLFVTGSSMANMLAVLVARRRALGPEVRHQGVSGGVKRLTGYTSAAAHRCVGQAMDLSGLGLDALRIIPVDEHHRVDKAALQAAILADRAAGMSPFFVAGTAGTVDVGAIDDLSGLAEICARESLWFHVDGAFAALAMLSPALRPLLRGLERADSVAFDFHKWGQVPYDAGFLIVRDGQEHKSAFASPAAYLRREVRGLAGGEHWPSDYGPDLSRGFRALKTWFTLKVYGADALARVMEGTCALGQSLKERVLREPELELLAPVALNIVCFRYRAVDSDTLNAELAVRLQESGVAAPSTTVIGGRLALRAALFNHRTTERDLDALIATTLALGRGLANSSHEPPMEPAE